MLLTVVAAIDIIKATARAEAAVAAPANNNPINLYEVSTNQNKHFYQVSDFIFNYNNA